MTSVFYFSSACCAFPTEQDDAPILIDDVPARAYGPELPPKEPARPARSSHADLLVQDPKNFELFFQILEVPGIDQEHVWELLKTLPPSREIQVVLHEADASPQVWQNLFQRSPLHKRIYVLDLCDKIIADKDLEVGPTHTHAQRFQGSGANDFSALADSTPCLSCCSA